MSDEIKSTKPDKPAEVKPAWYMAGPGGQKPVRVAKIQFRSGEMFDFPSKPNARALGDQRFVKDPQSGGWTTRPDQVNAARFRIWYLPWMGTFVVLFLVAGEVDPVAQPTFVPREWCAWEPAPE